VSKQRARELLVALGCTVAGETTVDALLARPIGAPPDVVLVGLPEGQRIVTAFAGRERRPVIIAALAGPLGSAPERADAAGADLLVLRPHSTDSLIPALHAAQRVARLRGERDLARAGEATARDRLARYGQADTATGFRHFDFFKQVLVMELKRAKRYGYSLAASVVAFDPWPGEPPPPSAVRRLRSQVATAITASIRDIDMPVDLASDRVLVFLPYTDLPGAEQVGRRIAQAVREHGEVAELGATYRVTVSIGIAAQRQGQPVSFARLMRDASTALRAAMLKGGGRVVVRR
jgi:PleD family two-component response regulator